MLMNYLIIYLHTKKQDGAARQPGRFSAPDFIRVSIVAAVL